MASFIYFYSKFTEEFLLLTAAGIFTLSAIYCYHWVVKRRLLGAARNQLPAGVVKAYLNQIINEAQFVRTQLFGLVGGADAKNAAAFQASHSHRGTHAATDAHHAAPAPGANAIPSDLLARLQALEAQLSEKESMVVNINVEKTKLLEEVENLKQSQKAANAAPAPTGNQDGLLEKIKNLEERLEEYALFEDDLANLKRLQQENNVLKKRLEEGGSAETAAAQAPVSPVSETVSAKTEESTEESLSETFADSIADTIAAQAPPVALAAVPSIAAEIAPSLSPADSLAAAPAPVETNESINPSTEASPSKDAELNQNAIDKLLEGMPAVPANAKGPDEFEKLVDSVEDSLEQNAQAAKAAAPAPEAPVTPVEAAPAEAKVDENLAGKTDEELLKEFENLLNS